jgi:hypothetical protein
MAQEAAAPGRVIGEVLASDTAARRMTIKTDGGEQVAVSVAANALYLRVPPGEKDLKKASPIALADVGTGDRVLARGRLAADGKSIDATAVIVMTKADLAQKHQHDREEWERRGTAGAIAAIDGAAHRFTITLNAREGSPSAFVETAPNTEFLRYAPDSVRFSDAKPSTFAALAVGDHVRVLGDRSADGAEIKAEQIVSGAFRSIAGTVSTVDAAAGALSLTDLATKKQITVSVSSGSTLRRLTPMAAAFLARRLNPEAQADERPLPASQTGARQGNGASGGAGGDPQQMLERMPVLALGELKPGDAVIVSGTKGADSGSIAAITLVAGVEPLLRAAPPRQVGGAWNFGDIGLPQ